MRLFVNSGPPSPFCGCKESNVAHPLPNPYVSLGLAYELERAWFLLPEVDENLYSKEDLNVKEAGNAPEKDKRGVLRTSETGRIYRDSVMKATAPFGGDSEVDEEAVRCSMSVGRCEELAASEGKAARKCRVNVGGGNRFAMGVCGDWMPESGQRRYVFGSLNTNVGRCDSPDTADSSSPTVTATVASMCNTPCTAVSTLPTSSDAEDACTSEVTCAEERKSNENLRRSEKKRAKEMDWDIEFPCLPRTSYSEHVRPAFEVKEHVKKPDNADAVEDAIHCVFRETVGPLLAVDAILMDVGDLGFDPFEMRVRFERAVTKAVDMRSEIVHVPEKALRASLRKVALASVRELWKERTLLWRIIERFAHPNTPRSLTTPIPTPSPSRTATLFPTYVHAAPVRLPGPAPPRAQDIKSLSKHFPYGAPAIALSAFVGTLFAAGVLDVHEWVGTIAQMRGALGSGLVRPRVVLASIRALVCASGEKACRGMQSAGAARALKDLGGESTGQRCKDGTKGWSRVSKGLAEDIKVVVDLLFEECDKKRRAEADARAASRRSRKFQKMDVVWGEEPIVES